MLLLVLAVVCVCLGYGIADMRATRHAGTLLRRAERLHTEATFLCARAELLLATLRARCADEA